MVATGGIVVDFVDEHSVDVVVVAVVDDVVFVIVVVVACGFRRHLVLFDPWVRPGQLQREYHVCTFAFLYASQSVCVYASG